MDSSGVLTSVFCDYECLYWGMHLHGELPDLESLVSRLKEKGHLDSIFFFGDFTDRNLQAELPRLRSITSNIIDCSAGGENPKKNLKKNFTDFIMLDNIYRTAFQRRDIKQYIIITGDGHFSTAVAYLKTFLNLTVGICGVQGTMSRQLKQSASWYIEIYPSNKKYHDKLLQNIRWAEDNNLIPTFKRTVDATSKHYNIPDKKLLANQLSELIKQKLITQTTVSVGNGALARILVPNWELIYRHGLIEPVGSAVND